jgi:macrolide-specific efflux system membrane fusion protein
MILTGLKTRTQAEVIYGLQPGDTVVTGETKLAGTSASNGSNRNSMPRPPPFMGR